MSNSPPYALIIDCDSEARRLASASLGEAGFVVAGFAEPRGALGALAVRPADLAVIAGHRPDGSDAYAAARQMRHCQNHLKVLFTAAAGVLPATPGANDGHAVTQPFDRRRFLGSVFELAARGQTDAGDRWAAELGLLEAELACLLSRYGMAERSGAGSQAQDLIHRIRDTVAARQVSLLAGGAPGETR